MKVYKYSINLFNIGFKKCNIELFFFMHILFTLYVPMYTFIKKAETF